jgi:outer membrane receptor protein involved in Fe transport
VVRHRGVETSLTGHFLANRLSLLAGAVVMQPRVSGPLVGVTIGDRPAGTPSVYARLDATYRTDLLGGLTPTLAVIYTGSRAAGSRPQASLGGKQLMLPGYATVDLGIRQQFKIGQVAASYRIVVQNVFDSANWRVLAANTVQMEERRRVLATIAADF